MGNTTSSTNTIDNSAITKSITDILTRNNNSITVNNNNLQQLNLSNIKYHCTLKVNQTMNISSNVIQSIDSNVQSNLINSIMTSLSSQADAALKVKTEGTAIANATDMIQVAKNSLRTDFNTKLTTENINAIIQNVNNVQDNNLSNLVIDPCNVEALSNPNISPLVAQAITECQKVYKDNTCDVSQDMTTQIVAQQLTASALTIISNNSDVSNVVTLLKSNTVVENTGILSEAGKAVSGVLSALGGMFTGPIITIVLIIIGFFVFIYFFFNSEGGQKTMNIANKHATAHGY